MSDDNTAKKNVEQTAEGAESRKQRDSFEATPDAKGLRNSSLGERNSALDQNQDKHSGSAGGQGRSIEIVGVDEQGRQQILAARQSDSDKDILKAVVQRTRISRPELEEKASAGDAFAKDIVRQMKSTSDATTLEQLQRNADRLYGRGEFANIPVQLEKPRHLTDTGALEKIERNESLDPEKRQLASQIIAMRKESKAIGVDTEVIDQFSDNVLQPELMQAKEVPLVFGQNVTELFTAVNDVQSAIQNGRNPVQELYDNLRAKAFINGIDGKQIDGSIEKLVRGLNKAAIDGLNEQNFSGSRNEDDAFDLTIKKYGTDYVSLQSGLLLGELRFAHHTIEGITDLVRLGSALERKLTMPYADQILDVDPESTQKLTKILEGELQICRFLFHSRYTIPENAPLHGLNIDPAGEAMTRNAWKQLPEEFKKQVKDFENADGVEKIARGTELFLNVATLFIGGASSAGGKGGRALEELSLLTKTTEGTEETTSLVRLLPSLPDLSDTGVLLKALENNAKNIVQKLSLGPDHHFTQLLHSFDDALSASIREGLRGALKNIRLEPVVLGPPENLGSEKLWEEFMLAMAMPGKPKKVGKAMPFKPAELDKEPLPTLIESGNKEPVFVTGKEQEITTRFRAARAAGRSAIVLENMAEVQLRGDHHLLRLSPTDADIVIQRKLHDKIDEVVKRHNGAINEESMREAAIEIRKILLPVSKKDILEKNVSIVTVERRGGGRQYFVAVNGGEPIPGTLPKPAFSEQYQAGKTGNMPRDADSEYKQVRYLLEHFNESDLDKIFLYTEQAPCTSCEASFKWLTDKFKDAEVNILPSSYDIERRRWGAVKKAYKELKEKSRESGE